MCINNRRASLAVNKPQCQIPSSLIPEVKGRLEFDLPHTSIPHPLNVRNSYYWTNSCGRLSQLNSTLLLLSNHNTKSSKMSLVPMFQKTPSLSHSSPMHLKLHENPGEDINKACVLPYPTPNPVGIFKLFPAKKQTLKP